MVSPGEWPGVRLSKQAVCPPAGLTPPRLVPSVDSGDKSQEEALGAEALPGAALGPGWRRDNQVRFHGRWWLLGLAEA